MLKRIVAGALCCALAAVAFAEGKKEAPAQTGPVKLRMLVSGGTEVNPGKDQETVYTHIEGQLKKQYGLDVDLAVTIGASGEIGQRLNLMIAAKELDVWNNNKDPKMLADKGFLAPLNTALDKYGKNLRRIIPEQWKWDTATIDGEILAIPTYNNVTNKAFWIRKELAAEMGIPFKRTMKISEFEAYLAKAKQMHPELITLGRTINPSHWFAEMMNAVGFPKNMKNADGTLKPYLIGKNNETARYVWDPEYRVRLELLQRWWKAGYFHPEWLTWSRNEGIAMVEQGKCAAVAGEWWRYGVFERLIVEKKQDWKQIVLVQDDGRAVYQDRRGWDSRAMFVVGTSKDKAGAAVALADWLVTSPENMFTANWGVKGTHWDYLDAGMKRIKSLVGPNAPDLKDHDDIVLGALRDLVITVPYDRQIAEAQSVAEFDHYAFDALEPQTVMVVAAPPDAAVNYGALAQVQKDMGLTFNVGDSETYIHEIEAKVMLGQMSVDDGIKNLQEFGRKNGFDAWWAERMKIAMPQMKK